METFFKIFGAIVGAIIVIIIGLHLYFTNQRLKSMIMPKVDQAVGRKVEVKELSISVLRTFPDVGLVVDHAFVPDDHGDTLASFNELVVGLKLIPLLSKKISISNVTLVKPHFVYIVHPNGKSNLDDVMKRYKSGSKAQTQSSQSLPTINIDNFTLKDGHIGYISHPDNTSMLFLHMNMDLTLQYAKLINSTMKVSVGGLSVRMKGKKYLTGLPFQLTQQSTVDLNGEVVDLKKGQLSIKGLGLDLTGQIQHWSSIAPNVNLQFKSSSDDFGALLKLVPEAYQSKIKGLQTKGSFTLSGNVKGAVGGKKVPDFRMTMSVKNGYVKNPELQEPVQNITADLIANNNEVQIRKFSANAGSNTLDASGKWMNPLKDNGPFSVNLNADVDLGTVGRFYSLKDLGISTMKGNLKADVNIKGKANNLKNARGTGEISLNNGFLKMAHTSKPIEQITLQSNISDNRLTIKKADLKSGKNVLDMSGMVRDYLSKNPVVDLKINSNVNLGEIHSYYDISKYVKKMSGLADAKLAVNGPIYNTQKLLFDGQMSLKNVNIESDSLPKPVKNLNVNLHFNQSRVNLGNLSLLYGKSDFKVDGNLRDYMELTAEKSKQKSPSTLTGNYSSRFINVDELMNWQANQQSDTATVPVNLPHLNSSVQARVDSMIVLGVPMTKMQATVKTTPKQIDMPKGNLDMFGGKVSGMFAWKVPDPKHTHIQFQGKMDSLRVEKFFKEYPVLGKKSNFYKYVSGHFSADAHYETDLNQYLDPVMKSTKAKGSFGMKKVKFTGNPIQKEVAKLLKTPELNNLALDDWKANFTIDKGILTLQNMKLTSKNLGVALNGTENLINDKLDYKLKVYLPERYGSKIEPIIGKQAIKALTTKNKTIAVPLAVKGTTEHPVVTVDKDVVKSILKDYLKNALKNKLKGLFD